MNPSHLEPASGADRYSAVIEVIHWATALLAVATIAYGAGGSERSA